MHQMSVRLVNAEKRGKSIFSFALENVVKNTLLKFVDSISNVIYFLVFFMIVGFV